MKTLIRRMNVLEKAIGLVDGDRLTIWTCWFGSPVSMATCNGRQLNRLSNEPLEEFTARAEVFFPWPVGSSLRVISQGDYESQKINQIETLDSDVITQ